MSLDAQRLREVLRATFGTDAELYDRLRPEYPRELFVEIERITRVRPGSRVLEVGCGTGKATRSLAQRGYAVTAVELSDTLAALARRNLKQFPNIRILTADFEKWQLPAEPFDLVVAAQALHWIDPGMRFEKLAAALAPGGYAAIFGHGHVAGGTADFFVEVQECYERFMPGTPRGLRLVEAESLAYADLGMAGSGWFETPLLRRYLWTARYTTREYINLLRTYSNHIHLESQARVELFSCIARLIDEHYSGSVEKAYVTDLVLGREGTPPETART